MKSCIFFIILALSAASCVKDKQVVSKYENGQPKVVHVNLKEDKEKYRHISYFRNGQVKKRGIMQNGKMEGKWKFYRINGSLKSINMTCSGLYCDTQIYYDTTGSLKAKTIFLEPGECACDSFSARMRHYYPNGRLHKKWTVKAGKMEGKYMEYNKSGQLISSGFYRNGEKDSVWKIWYDNGALWEVTRYREGKRTGEQKFFYKNGNFEFIRNFKKDSLHGDYYEGHKNGELMVVGRFRNGEKAGRWVWLDSTGKITHHETF